MARLTARLVQGAVVSGCVAALAIACSASPNGSKIANSGGSGNGSNSGGSGNGTGFGGSNSGGNGAGINLGGSGNGGGSGGNNVGDACAATHTDGNPVPLDMYVMMDKSGSMIGSKWNGVTSAITSFVNAGPAVAGVGVGMQFFPQGSTVAYGCTGGVGTECSPQTYLPPAVTIQTLPGVAPQIISAMAANAPQSNNMTPTVPAMQSAGQATTAYAKQHPDHKVIIVLATDGSPNDCCSDISGVAAVAQAAFQSTPSVMTFVIGIGNVSGLNQIAQAGGSGSTGAIIVSSATANQDFLDAMNKIRGQALGCEYLLPTPPNGGTFNPSKVNVVYTPSGGTGQLLYNVGDASKCGAQGGWYYDNNTTPTKIILCPASCNTVQGSKGSVDIQLGCDTVGPPVQ